MTLPNILLIVLDSVRAKNVSLYGYGEATTPNIDRFARRATTYLQARSPGICSLPSHTSIFTGLDVPEHGMTDDQTDRLEPGETVWETLQDQGYRTAVFSQNAFITQSDWGLHRGFDERVNFPRRTYPFNAGNPHDFVRSRDVDDPEHRYLTYAARNERPLRTLGNGVVYKMEAAGIDGFLPLLLQRTPGDSSKKYISQFRRWLRSRENQWAACINLMDAHAPYKPAVEYDRWGGETIRTIHESMEDHRWDFYTGRRPWWQREALESLYNGGIHQADHYFGSILDLLEERGEIDDTLIVLTSDHGEGFGERSRLKHQFRTTAHHTGIHEVNLHVPLVVKYPRQQDCRTCDVLVTLAQFPEVVSDVTSRNGSDRSFVRDRPVIVYSNDRSEDFPDSHIDDLDRDLFRGEPMAYYTQGQDRVVKYATWGDVSKEIEIIDPANSMPIGDTDVAVKERIREFTTPRNVRGEGAGTLSDGSRELLEDLGYIN